MEQKQIFQKKLQLYRKALSAFAEILQIDYSDFNEVVKDAIKNGQIQKFEYCTELTWKTIKRYLYIHHAIDAKSPRQSIKELYLVENQDEKEYELLMNMLDDRNRLSHEYSEDFFERIVEKLPAYLKVMKEVYLIMDKAEY